MNDDDNKNINTEVEETADVVVDVTPVGAEELSSEHQELSGSEAEEIPEELSEQSEMEQEDSEVEEPSAADEAAEEAVQDEVDEENAQAIEDLGVSEESSDESLESSEDDVIPSEADSSSEASAKLEGSHDEAQDSGQDQNDSTDEATTAPAVDENPNARWYVVHTYSGHENRVATNLRQRIESEHLEHKIVDILVPTQDKIEIRGGKKEQVKEKVFPGYILVKMELDNMAWIAVRTTQGVIGFVGAGTKPMPISDAEVKSIVQFMNQGAAPTFKEVFMVDDTVKIIDGPFADFIGKVESVDKEKGKLRVLVSIFGRETPVELDFLQVSKL